MPNVMAALPNIGDVLCESFVIPFLVQRRKLWLTPTARVPCSNAANIGERKIWTQSKFCSWQNSRAPENVYTVYQRRRRPNIVQSLVDIIYLERRRCSNEAKTRNPLKFAGVPQTRQQISAVNGPRTIYGGDIAVKQFFRLSIHSTVAKI